MREMSENMATLLKSKNMVGENAPSHEVTVEGASGSDYWGDYAKYTVAESTSYSQVYGAFVVVDNYIYFAHEEYIPSERVYVSKLDTATGSVEMICLLSDTVIEKGMTYFEGHIYVMLSGMDMFKIDLTTKTPTMVYDAPTAFNELIVYNDAIYASRRNAGGTADDLAVFDVNTNTWTNVVTMAAGRRLNGLAVMGTDLFAIEDGSTNPNRGALLKLNGSSFTTVAPAYSSLYNDLKMPIAMGGTIYAITYEQGTSVDWCGGALLKWNGSDAWILQIPMNTEKRQFTNAIATDGTYVYCTTTRVTTEQPNPLSLVRAKADFSAWEVVCWEETGLDAWGGMGLAVVGNKVYGFHAPEFVKHVPVIGLPVKSISINRDKNIAGLLNLAIDNKDGANSVDVSGVLLPNVEVVVKQGYGEERVTTFTGLIDRVEMWTFPQEVLVTCRDKIKLALDQLVTVVDGENIYRVVTYTDQTVEAIFSDLCTKAGLTTGTVEETGVTLSEKTFSWETYGDAFQWLADLVGFEFTADEDGLVHFRADEAPTTPTVAYVFKEGEDIINLGYVVDDNELYYDIYVYGAEVDGTVVYGYSPYYGRTNYNVLEQKILKIDAPDCDTYLKCQEIANRTAKLMASRARVVTFQAIGIPWLQIGDFIQVIESSTTISEIYRITGLQTNMDENGYTMTITCYYHSYGEA